MKKVEEEFIGLIRRHEGIIYKICRFYCRDTDDIQDLYQEIVMNLWKSYPGFRNDSKISTWLYRISLNCAITYNRNKKKIIPVVEISPNLSESLSQIENNALIERLYDIVNHLNKIERSIIFLYLEGKSHREISDLIGCSVTNVGTKIQRIKIKMADINQKY